MKDVIRDTMKLSEKKYRAISARGLEVFGRTKAEAKRKLEKLIAKQSKTR